MNRNGAHSRNEKKEKDLPFAHMRRVFFYKGKAGRVLPYTCPAYAKTILILKKLKTKSRQDSTCENPVKNYRIFDWAEKTEFFIRAGFRIYDAEPSLLTPRKKQILVLLQILC
jgi:hypothetical protein